MEKQQNIDFEANFKDWIENSDSVIKVAENGYKTQCTGYRRIFNLSQLRAYFRTEYFNTI